MAKIVISKYKDIYKEIRAVAESFSIAKVFYDFIEILALEIAIKTGNIKHKEKLENTMSQYKDKDLIHYNQFKDLVIKEFQANRFQDVFGVLFHELLLHNEFKGQFFTPYTLSLSAAKMSITDKELKEKDFLLVNEPACGSGGMIIAASQIVEELKYNYAEKLIWIAQDLDLHCVYMCYIQLTLTGVSAEIQHTDTLKNEIIDRFYTLGYLLNNCHARIKSRNSANRMLEVIREIEKENNTL